MKTFIIYPTMAKEITVKELLKSMNIPFGKRKDTLPAHVIAGIKKGQEDFEYGNTISFEEFQKELSIQAEL